MIVDLKKFIGRERPTWEELDEMLKRVENQAVTYLSLDEIQRLHYLYERTGAGLMKISTFAAEPNLVRYLESLLTRAYAEMQDVPSRTDTWSPRRWLFRTFPQTFRKHFRFFLAALTLTVLGGLFGGGAVAFDPDAKAAIVPFPHLLENPSERVREEENKPNQMLATARGRFSAALMTNNTQVSILALALGVTWGIGTLILLFYNGVILGAVLFDYVRAGQSVFLMGWLLPHGVVEIPAILIAGQAGLLLGQALIGWNSKESVNQRLRSVAGSLVTLISGAALLLVWAGLVEAFLSQYHEPIVPYQFKIVFGLIELATLLTFLVFAGRDGGPVGTRSRASGRARSC
ncbi:MAG: stage II sporulation protein M [Verrucomicrobia bacterium]|nr:stage II sporulation protein M [Verrucomicrobiota bacterium]